jgi:hypothetical protein
MLLHYRSSKHDRSTYSSQPLQQKRQIEFYIEKGSKIDKSSIDSADVKILNLQKKKSLMGGLVSDKLINS